MGYANDGLKANEWKPVCSQFIKIGLKDGEDMVLKDLVPGGGWKKEDYIKFLGTSGQVLKQAYYITQAEIDQIPFFAKDQWPTTPGWYNRDDQKVNLAEEPLPFGTAILAFSSADSHLTSSGEVIESQTGKISFDLKANDWAFVGNCTPINRKLKDFSPGNGWKKEDYIKFLGTGGQVLKQAYYITQAEIDQIPFFAKDQWPTTPGWYNRDDQKVSLAEESVDAGSGFLAFSSANSTIEIPSAL